MAKIKIKEFKRKLGGGYGSKIQGHSYPRGN